ncbi:MAG: glycosyltransferase, partial [Elusimicrobia bacterium]|nr:glycosyltransferase [Elusimicrobiota bacterium]
MAAKTKIAHIITLLELGGAQQVALHIFKNLDRELYEPILICGRGAYFDKEAERLDRPVFFINSLVRQVHPLLDLFALIELTLVLRREKPQIVHTHSSKAGILGRLAARLAGVATI